MSFTCRICGATFFCSEDLRRHKLVHEDASTPPRDVDYPNQHHQDSAESASTASTANTAASSQRAQSSHQTRSETTRGEANRKRRHHNTTHQRSRHGRGRRRQRRQRRQRRRSPKRVSCHLCAKTFTQVGSKNRHVKRVHQKLKPHICEVCGVAFGERSNLDSHRRTHSLGEKRFKCTKCDYTCHQSGQLKRHMKTHEQQSPYICSKCGKVYKLRKPSEKHEQNCPGPKKPKKQATLSSKDSGSQSGKRKKKREGQASIPSSSSSSSSSVPPNMTYGTLQQPRQNKNQARHAGMRTRSSSSHASLSEEATDIFLSDFDSHEMEQHMPSPFVHNEDIVNLQAPELLGSSCPMMCTSTSSSHTNVPNTSFQRSSQLSPQGDKNQATLCQHQQSLAQQALAQTNPHMLSHQVVTHVQRQQTPAHRHAAVQINPQNLLTQHDLEHQQRQQQQQQQQQRDLFFQNLLQPAEAPASNEIPARPSIWSDDLLSQLKCNALHSNVPESQIPHKLHQLHQPRQRPPDHYQPHMLAEPQQLMKDIKQGQQLHHETLDPSADFSTAASQSRSALQPPNSSALLSGSINSPHGCVPSSTFVSTEASPHQDLELQDHARGSRGQGLTNYQLCRFPTSNSSSSAPEAMNATHQQVDSPAHTFHEGNITSRASCTVYPHRVPRGQAPLRMPTDSAYSRFCPANSAIHASPSQRMAEAPFTSATHTIQSLPSQLNSMPRNHMNGWARDRGSSGAFGGNENQPLKRHKRHDMHGRTRRPAACMVNESHQRDAQGRKAGDGARQPPAESE